MTIVFLTIFLYFLITYPFLQWQFHLGLTVSRVMWLFRLNNKGYFLPLKSGLGKNRPWNSKFYNNLSLPLGCQKWAILILHLSRCRVSRMGEFDSFFHEKITGPNLGINYNSFSYGLRFPLFLCKMDIQYQRFWNFQLKLIFYKNFTCFWCFSSPHNFFLLPKSKFFSY